MKKEILLYLLVILFFNIHLAGQTLQVYKKIPSGTCSSTNCINFDFNNDLRIVETSMGSGKWLIEHDVIEAVNPIEFTSVSLSVNDDILKQKYLMSFFHLHKALDYSESLFGADFFSKIQFNQEFNTDPKRPEIQVSKLSTGTDEYMIDYGYNLAFDAIAEDAFAIASGLFKAYHMKSLGGIAENPPQLEGVDYAIANYFAYDYMQNSGDNLDTGNEIYEHAGLGSIGSFRWETLHMNLDDIPYQGYYSSSDFVNSISAQMQSELLSATLWQLREEIEIDKVTSLLIGSLSELNSGATPNQLIALQTIYENTYTITLDEGVEIVTYNYEMTEADLCFMLEVFYEVYGDLFLSKVTYFPNTTGDVHIKDELDDDGTEPNTTTASITNSPSIWNRHTSDFTPEHQNPYGDNLPAIQYVNVAIDGNFCDLQGMLNIVETMKIKIYRSVPKLGYQWPINWNNENVNNDPEGDLIGTFYAKDNNNLDEHGNPQATFRNDSGDIVNFDWSNNGNLLILSLPWEVPDYSSIYLSNLMPKGSLLGATFQDAFLARVESAVYDEMATTEVSNVYNNVKNNNNIAMKTTNILAVYEVDKSGTTPGFLLPEFDDEPGGDVVLSINPSTHEPVRPVNPNPTSTDGPFVPVRPVFNNYMDYGEVRIILEEDMHQDWVTNGSHGNGFVVNSDNEIIVTASDFTLRGLPRTISGGRKSAIGVRYYAENGIFTSRTGFDIVAENTTGDFIGRTHFEVRDDEGSSVPRSNNSDTGEEISIYPNPVGGNTLYVENLTTDASYSIYGIDGKAQTIGKFNKDQKSIDISELNIGVYFLQIRQENGKVETKKLIKTH